MKTTPDGLADAVAQYARKSVEPFLADGSKTREDLQRQFPLEGWPDLPLERFALGHDGFKSSFTYLLEFQSPSLGSIRGGSSKKLIIFKRTSAPGWYYPSEYSSENEAWADVRNAFVQAFELAKQDRWDEIADLTPLRGGPALLLKTLHLYFPEKIIPICSQSHLRHFLMALDRPEGSDKNLHVVHLNQALREAVRATGQFDGWTTNEIERFLYSWDHPKKQRRVVKIAPGANAKLWEECLAGNFICVGWDEIGDLNLFESKEDYRAVYDEAFRSVHKGNKALATRKAKELWTLRELEPGDLVVANKGTSKVLAVGEVVEPGYEWREDRENYQHTVTVKWDTTRAREIPPQKRWAFVTVEPVSSALQGLILDGSPLPGEPAVPSLSVSITEGVFAEMAEALERKKQVILYGPPGTGKTWSARRFSVSWLLSRGKPEVNLQESTESKFFAAQEKLLSTGQVSGRVWWVVASPKIWSWEKLFEGPDQLIDFPRGRLSRNYPLLKHGDLVIGYQATPDKKIRALARVSRPPAQAKPDAGFYLQPVAKIQNGPSYDELKQDPFLSASEPIRFNNQGTLFSLTSTEFEHLSSRLLENNPELEEHLAGGDDVGPLTILTFHPSYSYEDFVEGFRPTEGQGGGLSLRLEDGIFKRICRKASSNPDRDYLLVIDEINRANIGKVFGELITLLESDKRDLELTLPQSKESFSIPPNVFLIGTMNTADRSIKLLDAALRRRFAFIEIMPSSDLLTGATVGTLDLAEFLEGLNQRVAEHLGRERQIGHSFLMSDGDGVDDEREFARCFRQEIMPLLQEYCYDDFRTLALLLGGKIINANAGSIETEIVSDDQELIAALEKEFTGGEQGV